MQPKLSVSLDRYQTDGRRLPKRISGTQITKTRVWIKRHLARCCPTSTTNPCSRGMDYGAGVQTDPSVEHLVNP